MSYADIKIPDQQEIVVGRILENGKMNLLYFSDRDDHYKFEEEETHIKEEYILQTFDDPTESDLGLTRVGDNEFVLTDPDYVPSESEDEEESEDESLVDEDEEEDEED